MALFSVSVELISSLPLVSAISRCLFFKGSKSVMYWTWKSGGGGVGRKSRGLVEQACIHHTCLRPTAWIPTSPSTHFSGPQTRNAELWLFWSGAQMSLARKMKGRSRTCSSCPVIGIFIHVIGILSIYSLWTIFPAYNPRSPFSCFKRKTHRDLTGRAAWGQEI